MIIIGCCGLRTCNFNAQEASVYEANLVFRYGPDFDKLAYTRLIASGLCYI